jgi:thiamine transport system permease protein
LFGAASTPPAVSGSDGFTYIFHVARFTLIQAGASALLSLALALAVARAGWRRLTGPAGKLLITFSFLPVILPTTVAASGLIGVWGQSGIISGISQHADLPSLPPVYGIGAVLLAHVFFNAPLMMRVLTGALSGIPAAHWRQSAQWGLTEWQRFRLIEWPALRQVVPGLLALVFLLCFTSFALVLMLGGGPAVTTLEVSIYTALRFDFDLPRAAQLACLQLLICALVVIGLIVFSGPSWAAMPTRLQRPLLQRGEKQWTTRIADYLFIVLFVFIAVLPVVVVIVKGIGPHLADVLAWPAFWRALLNSLCVGLASGILATSLAFMMATARTRRVRAGLTVWWLDVAVSLYLAVSAIVLGTGLFILLRPVANIFTLAPALVLLANMLVALPFAYRVIEGRMAALAATHDRLCAGLGIRGWRRLRWIMLPALAPELGYAAGLSAALSLGDMTVIALFGSQQFQTLPWLLYQTMARYRSGEAAALALLLLCLTVGIFLLFHLMSRKIESKTHA